MLADRHVAILIFDDVEVLDFAGPFEVFSVAGREVSGREGAFAVYTVAETTAPIQGRGGLAVVPAHTFETAPVADVVVVPGGWGARAAMRNEAIGRWVLAQTSTADVVLSVCTGALILGAAGLLDGLPVTTHASALHLLSEVAPAADVRAGERYLDTGAIVTAAGISAGIDAALHVVARLTGEDHAAATARHMEYAWSPNKAGQG